MSKATIPDNKEVTQKSLRHHNFPGSRFPPLSPPVRLTSIVVIFILAIIVTLFVWYLKS